MRKLRLTPEEMTGLQIRAHFLKLARSLQSELPWISGARESGRIDGRNGIDFIVYVTPIEPGRVIKIPFRINACCSDKDCSTDELVVALIREELTKQREANVDFVEQFAKTQPRPAPKYHRQIDRTHRVAFQRRLQQIQEFEAGRHYEQSITWSSR